MRRKQREDVTLVGALLYLVYTQLVRHTTARTGKQEREMPCFQRAYCSEIP